MLGRSYRPDMEELTAAEAARWLGISRVAVDLAAREGRLPVVAGDGPRRFAREVLEGYHHLRMNALTASLARSRETPVTVARKVRRGLHSSTETGLPRPVASKLAAMPDTWRSLFNRAELAAATVPDGGPCRWCKALEFGEFLGLRPMEFGEARVELFGGPPCKVCAPGFLEPFMAALSERVHSGRHRPPDARAEAAAAAAAAVPPVPRPQPAQPVQRDDGRELVAARLRTVRARLKDAKRRGDQRCALRLAQMVRDLEQDAAAVDGRPLSAAARTRFMGNKACGTPVGAPCSCHPGPKRRGRR